MAILSNKAYLMRKANGGSAFTKLLDITSIPDLGGAPDQIDVTTLSDLQTRNINGIQSVSALEFGAWYDKDKYSELQTITTADRDKTQAQLDTYQVWFGENGVYGIFEWQGKLSVYVGSVESNAAVTMTVTMSDEGVDALRMVDGASA
jgi:hypothetical protein